MEFGGGNCVKQVMVGLSLRCHGKALLNKSRIHINGLTMNASLKEGVYDTYTGYLHESMAFAGRDGIN